MKGQSTKITAKVCLYAMLVVIHLVNPGIYRYMLAPFALEASIGVNWLKVKPEFTGNTTDSTTGNDRNKVILHDREFFFSQRQKLGVLDLDLFL